MRQAWGIDEPQGFWSAFGKNFAYNAWNVVSFGALARQDELVDQNLAGQVSDAQYWNRTAINFGSSTAVAVATIMTAGAATTATTAAVTAAGVSNPLAAGLIGGAISGAGYGAALQGARDAIEVLGTQTKSLAEVEASDYFRAAGLGALLVAPLGGAQALAAQGAVGSTLVESAPPPRAAATLQGRVGPSRVSTTLPEGFRPSATSTTLPGGARVSATTSSFPGPRVAPGSTPSAAANVSSAARPSGPRASAPSVRYNRRSIVRSPYRTNRAKALQRDPTCQYCQVKPSTTADHVVSAYDADALVGAKILTPQEAVSLVNELENLLGACPSCNSSKGNVLPGNTPGTWRPANPSVRAIDVMKKLGTWREGQ